VLFVLLFKHDNETRLVNIVKSALTNFLKTCSSVRKPSAIFCAKCCFSANARQRSKKPCVSGKVLEEDTNVLAVVKVMLLVVVIVVSSATSAVSAVGDGII
jgi:hypothetical protein